MRLPISEFVTPAEAFTPTDQVSKVIGFLRSSRLYEAFIEEGGRTAMISIRDLLGTTNIATTKISTLMYYIPRLHPNSSVSNAATLMHDYRIKSLPVYREKKLAGQITSASIIARLLDTDIGLKASSIMTPNPIRVYASDNVSKAGGIMIRRKIDQLPVMIDDRLDGIVSSDQIVFNLMSWVDRNVKGDWREGRFDTPLAMFATKNVLTNSVSDTLRSIFANMSNSATNYSLIMNLDEVHGIITYRDYMKILAHRIAEDIPIYMVGLPEDPFEAETAKSKFLAAVRLLRTGFPEITEARAIIKMGKTEAPRKRYQVRIFIMSPYRHYSYRVFSYELADAFDYVNGWVKGIISSYKPKSKRTTEIPEFPP